MIKNCQMKCFIAALFLSLFTASLFGATVNGNLADSFGNAYQANSIQYTPVKWFQDNGSATIVPSVVIQQVTNGMLVPTNFTSVNAIYTAKILPQNLNIPPVQVLVPKTNAVYTFSQILALATNLTAYIVTNQIVFIPQIQAGTNILFTTNSGIVVINSTASGGGTGTATNLDGNATNQVSIISSVWQQTVDANGHYLTDTQTGLQIHEYNGLPISAKAGDGDTENAGGGISLETGSGYYGGDFYITAGGGYQQGGNIFITAGDNNSGNNGNITIQSGQQQGQINLYGVLYDAYGAIPPSYTILTDPNAFDAAGTAGAAINTYSNYEASLFSGGAWSPNLQSATGYPASSLVGAGTAVYSNASAFYLASNPSNYVAGSITNGLATTNFVRSYADTNGAATNAVASLNAATNGFLTTNKFVSLIVSSNYIVQGNTATLANLTVTNSATVSVPFTTTSSSQYVPATNEFITAGYINSILAFAQTDYGTTNFYTTNSGVPSYGSPVYFCAATNPGSIYTRTYPNTAITNGHYFTGLLITNISAFSGPIIVTKNIYVTNNNNNATLSLAYEVYYSTNQQATNFIDPNWSSSPFSVNCNGSTNSYTAVISIPFTTLPANSWIAVFAKASGVANFGGSSSVTFVGGDGKMSTISFNASYSALSSIYQPYSTNLNNWSSVSTNVFGGYDTNGAAKAATNGLPAGVWTLGSLSASNVLTSNNIVSINPSQIVPAITTQSQWPLSAITNAGTAAYSNAAAFDLAGAATAATNALAYRTNGNLYGATIYGDVNATNYLSYTAAGQINTNTGSKIGRSIVMSAGTESFSGTNGATVYLSYSNAINTVSFYGNGAGITNISTGQISDFTTASNNIVTKSATNASALYTPIALGTVGQVFYGTNFANLNQFSTNGTGGQFTVTGGGIVFTNGGIALNTNFLSIVTNSSGISMTNMDEMWSMSVNLTVGTCGTGNPVIGLGVKSCNITNTGTYSTLIGVVPTGASYITNNVLNTSLTGIMGGAEANFSYTNGNTLNLTVSRNKTKWRLVAQNVTSNTQAIWQYQDPYYASALGGNWYNLNANACSWALFNTSTNGSCTVNSITVTSYSPTNTLFAHLGDSKTLGAAIGTIDNRYAGVLSAWNGRQSLVYAGVSDTTREMLLSMPYFTNYFHPQFVTLNIGRNDLAWQTYVTGFTNNYAGIVNALTNAGIAVYHLQPMYPDGSNQGANTQNTVSNYLANTYGSKFIPIPVTIQQTIDSVHPNLLGHIKVANCIASHPDLAPYFPLVKPSYDFNPQFGNDIYAQTLQFVGTGIPVINSPTYWIIQFSGSTAFYIESTDIKPASDNAVSFGTSGNSASAVYTYKTASYGTNYGTFTSTIWTNTLGVDLNVYMSGGTSVAVFNRLGNNVIPATVNPVCFILNDGQYTTNTAGTGYYYAK